MNVLLVLGLLGTMGGKWAAVTVFVLLILLLIKLPRSVREMLGEDQFPWWKRTRFWAITIAVIQVFVYFIFG